MTKKELEKQAAEYGYTVEQVKEFRKHIKPFLRYAIKKTEEGWMPFLCNIVNYYCNERECPGLRGYLQSRLKFARPKDSGTDSVWWNENNQAIDEHKKLRIDFCKLQLKIVKP